MLAVGYNELIWGTQVFLYCWKSELLAGVQSGVRSWKDLCPACRSACRPACQTIVESWLDWCVRKPTWEAERRMLLWRRL